MNLTKCIKCKREILDTDDQCLFCGAPQQPDAQHKEIPLKVTVVPYNTMSMTRKIEAVEDTIAKANELIKCIDEINAAFGMDELPFFIKLSDIHDAASDMQYFLGVFEHQLGKELKKLQQGD